MKWDLAIAYLALVVAMLVVGLKGALLAPHYPAGIDARTKALRDEVVELAADLAELRSRAKRRGSGSRAPASPPAASPDGDLAGARDAVRELRDRIEILEPVLGIGSARVLDRRRLRDGRPLHPADVMVSIRYYQDRANDETLSPAERVDALWMLSGRLEGSWAIERDVADEAIQFLRRSSDPRFRQKVLWSLCNCTFPSVRVAALDVLIHDESWRARDGAVRALRLWTADEATRIALERASLSDPAERVRELASRMLGQ